MDEADVREGEGGGEEGGGGVLNPLTVSLDVGQPCEERRGLGRVDRVDDEGAGARRGRLTERAKGRSHGEAQRDERVDRALGVHSLAGVESGLTRIGRENPITRLNPRHPLTEEAVDYEGDVQGNTAGRKTRTTGAIDSEGVDSFELDELDEGVGEEGEDGGVDEAVVGKGEGGGEEGGGVVPDPFAIPLDVRQPCEERSVSRGVDRVDDEAPVPQSPRLTGAVCRSTADYGIKRKVWIGLFCAAYPLPWSHRLCPVVRRRCITD